MIVGPLPGAVVVVVVVVVVEVVVVVVVVGPPVDGERSRRLPVTVFPLSELVSVVAANNAVRNAEPFGPLAARTTAAPATCGVAREVPL